MILGVGHFYRLARAGYIMAREGVFALLDPALLPPAAAPLVRFANLFAGGKRDGAGSALVRALAQIGPSYVKLGQFLATRPDIVGGEIADALTALQDRMEPFGRDKAVAIVEKALGKKIDELFVSFGEPVAAASVAQVHVAQARYKDGARKVAVKVLRPGIEGQFARDLRDMYRVARFAERYSSEARRLRMIEVVDTLARTVRLETDFRLEAAAASEFADNVAGDPEIHVPGVDWSRTEREVLTLEWIEGVPLSDMERVAAEGYDLKAIGRNVLQSFLRHAMRDGFFHADMHQGNLFVDKKGRLVAIDFGIMGRLGLKERRFLAEILYGFITRDYKRVAEVHFEAGYVPATHSVEEFSQALRAIGEPMHTINAAEISMARLLDAALRSHRALRHAHAHRTGAAAKDHGRRRGRRPRLRSQARHLEDLRSRGALLDRGKSRRKAKIEDASRSVAELANLATRLPQTLQDAETAILRVSEMAERGVDLSPRSLEALADTRRRSDRTLLIGLALVLFAAMWIFGR